MISAHYWQDTQHRRNQLILPGMTLSVPAIISLVGAGGKTTALLRLSCWLRQQVHTLLITTTTRMCLPAAHHYDRLIIEPDPQRLLQRLLTLPPASGITYCCHRHDPLSNKVQGVASDVIDHLVDAGSPFRVILVEADGARHLPIKAPADHEPCIPAGSDWVIAVTGAETLNVPALPEQIHRWQHFAAVTGLQPGQPLDSDALVRLINHPAGMFKHTPTQAKRTWLINKLPQDARALYAFAQRVIRQTPRLDMIWLAAMQQQPALRYCLLAEKHHPHNKTLIYPEESL